jgi:hypothetical protein
MFWLPWEKLPDWILGPLLILAGGVFLAEDWPWSWHHLEGTVMAALGIGVFIHGLRKLRLDLDEDNKHPARGPRAARSYAQDMKPDFAKYTAAELRKILERLDKGRFPERAKEVNERLAAFDAQGREA